MCTAKLEAILVCAGHVTQRGEKIVPDSLRHGKGRIKGGDHLELPARPPRSDLHGAGLALFVRYLSSIQTGELLVRYFRSIRKSRKSPGVVELFKQILCFFADGTGFHVTRFDELATDAGGEDGFLAPREVLPGGVFVRSELPVSPGAPAAIASTFNGFGVERYFCSDAACDRMGAGSDGTVVLPWHLN